MKKTLLLLSSLLFASNALAVTPTCDYIAKESKYYGTSPLNGLELVASDERQVNPDRLKFSDHFSQYLRIANFQSVRMYEYEQDGNKFSFVTKERRKSGFYKGVVLKIILEKVSEKEYDVMFLTDEYHGELGNKTLVWSEGHHKNILADRAADRNKPIRYVVTDESLKAKKEFKCLEK